MIPVSRVEELFDAESVAPGAGNDMSVGGGGYEEQLAKDDDIVRVAGLVGTKAEVRDMIKAAGPGRLQVGGGRRTRRYKRSKRSFRRSRSSRRNRQKRRALSASE